MRTIQEQMTIRGFTESVDYSYIDDVLTALPKIRIINITPETPEGEEEEYFETMPDLETIKYQTILDIVSVISEYLTGKEAQRDWLNDYFNVSDGSIFSWTFSIIPKPTGNQLRALAPTVEARIITESRINSTVAIGSSAISAVTTAANYISGIDESSLSPIEVDAFLYSISPIMAQLVTSRRPEKAKILIQAVVPDAVFTEQIKSDLLYILRNF